MYVYRYIIFIFLRLLAAGKIGDSPIISDMNWTPQTHLGAEFQSERTIQLVPKP